MQPGGVNFRYFKLRLFYLSLCQRLIFFSEDSKCNDYYAEKACSVALMVGFVTISDGDLLEIYLNNRYCLLNLYRGNVKDIFLYLEIDYLSENTWKLLK